MSGGENANGGAGKPPSIPVRDALRPPLPKRFYKSAAVEPADGAFRVVLDGRIVRTPGKRELKLPSESLAAAIADEWQAQGERIDPATMPLTRLANAAIDGVADRWEAVASDIVAFAGSDLLCYRAEAPAGLVRRQAEAWDPLLDWAQSDLGAPLVRQTGIMPVAQSQPALAAVRRALDGLGALELAAVHVLTTLSGSAIVALALLQGRLSSDEAWSAALVDETWQSEQWGRDAEAEARLAQRRAEFNAAGEALRLLKSRR